MEHTTALDGIHVPLITPFAADGSVALDALEKLAGSLLDAGAAGLVALGTTGEPATLDDAERRAVVEVCAAVTPGTRPTSPASSAPAARVSGPPAPTSSRAPRSAQT
ncbi:dihydrodipicolinate synthase family protein, partial [Kitasatospora sp. NPDC001574]